MKLETQPQKTPGEIKVDEYVDRIKAGESKESILQGLSESFVSAIENKLELERKPESESIEKTDENVSIPPQYKDIDSEILEDIWIIPEYVDP